MMYEEWMPPQFKGRLRARGECWEWTGGRAKFGHGRVFIGHRTRRPMAHRMSWEAFHGPIPDNLCVLHSCDNPPCIRPGHLFLETKTENNTDRDTKGRTFRGPNPKTAVSNEQNPAHKLNNEQVNEIRSRYIPQQYGLVRDLCQEYKISKRHLFNIVNETSRKGT